MRYIVYQILSLISGFLTHFIFGSLVTLGSVSPYIASYLFYSGDSKITVADITILYPIVMVFQSIGLIISSFLLYDRYSLKSITILSTLFFSLSVLFTSLMKGYWGYIVFYGIFYGLFLGLTYMAAFRNTYSYFPNRKGMCGGVCMMAYGLSPLIFNQVFLSLVNPNNLKSDQRHFFPQEVANNLPFTLRILSLIYATIGIIATLTLIPKQSLQPSIITSHSYQAIQETLKDKEQQLSLLEGMKRNQFWKLHIVILSTMPFGIFVGYNYKEYGQTIVNNDSFLTLVGSIGAIFNFLGRIFWNFIFDYRSFKFILLTLNSLLILTCISLLLIQPQQSILYMIIVCANYFFYGANFGLFPTQTVRIYGEKFGTKIYPFVFVSFAFASIIQFVFHLGFSEKWGDAGLRYCLFIFLGLQVIAFILVFFLKFNYRKEEAKLFDLKA